MEIKQGIFCLLVALFMAAPKLTGACEVIYTFGDSNTDTGGVVAAGILTLGSPNGETFFGHPAGRISDGRLIIDFMVETLQLHYLSPYLESVGSNFENGANFAISGSLAISGENAMWAWRSPLDLRRQINSFINFKARISAESQNQKLLPRSKNQNTMFRNALYIIDIGQNDLNLVISLSDDVVQVVISNMISNISDAVKRLSDQGARHFWVHNTGPLGCLPETIKQLKSHPGVRFDEYGCIVSANRMASEFNSQLKLMVSRLRTRFPLACFTLVDIFSAKNYLITNARQLGFVDAFNPCYNCEDPQNHISWDGTHYTEAANRFVADWIVNGSLSDPPRPFVMACSAV